MGIFKDEGGNSVSIRWWIRWRIAKWHWRKWLLYSGMPKECNNFKQMIAWHNILFRRKVNEMKIDITEGKVPETYVPKVVSITLESEHEYHIFTKLTEYWYNLSSQVFLNDVSTAKEMMKQINQVLHDKR